MNLKDFKSGENSSFKTANPKEYMKELMENYPDGKASIQIRERIVLPLLTIQQYALLRINELNQEEKPDEALIKVYEKIVTRSLFGNTNASRNSA